MFEYCVIQYGNGYQGLLRQVLHQVRHQEAIFGFLRTLNLGNGNRAKQFVLRHWWKIKNK